MDMQVDVPQFKLAKIGAKRDRKKRGGFFWLGGAASSGGSGAATAVGGLAGLLLKTGVALVIGVLGVGAYNVGKTMAPPPNAAAGRSVFASSKAAAAPQSASNGTAVESAGPSGLSLISGSLDGMTPEQRAANAAAAEAAAKAEADRQAAADAQAAPGAPEAGGVPGGIDAAALAAAAGQAGGAPGADKKNGPFNSRFGALSTGLGGGNSGLAGGAGMSGGVGRSFDTSTKLGAAKGFGSARTPARTSARMTTAVGRGRGRALRQLDATNRQSLAANRSGAAETAAANADAPFSNNPGANSAITGGGAGTGSLGPAGAASAGSPNPTTSGGPTGGSEGCYVGSPDPNCAPADVRGHRDATPWTGMAKAAAAILVIASILLILAGIIAMNKELMGLEIIYAQWLGGIAAALGLIAALLGASIMGAGGGNTGLMYMVTGGIITAAGALVAFNPGEGQLASATTWQTVGMYGAVIGGLLGGGVGASGLMSKHN